MATVIVRRHGVFVSQQSMPDNAIDPFLARLREDPDQGGLAATILQHDGPTTRITIVQAT